jgi:hypothetical protein
MISRDTDPTTERGQSLNDFVIGVGLFLLVVGYTFAFLPTVFQPFLDVGRGTTQAADRTADHLVRYVLAENASNGTATVPGLLNAACTEAFFDDSITNPPDGCRFESTDLNSIAALPDTTRVNVTVLRDETVVERNGVTFTRGPDPTGASDIARTVRIATLDGKDVRVIVRTW